VFRISTTLNKNAQHKQAGQEQATKISFCCSIKGKFVFGEYVDIKKAAVIPTCGFCVSNKATKKSFTNFTAQR
jgi:hypothetical protein